MGLLVELCIRPRGEMPLSEPPLLADLLMIFILLRSLNPPGEEDVGETSPAFIPLWLFSAVQWKADFRRAPPGPPVTAAEPVGPPAFQR